MRMVAVMVMKLSQRRLQLGEETGRRCKKKRSQPDTSVVTTVAPCKRWRVSQGLCRHCRATTWCHVIAVIVTPRTAEDGGGLVETILAFSPLPLKRAFKNRRRKQSFSINLWRSFPFVVVFFYLTWRVRQVDVRPYRTHVIHAKLRAVYAYHASQCPVTIVPLPKSRRKKKNKRRK